MELRKSPRIALPDMEDRSPGAGRASCTFDFDPNLGGKLTDIGPGGFGIEIRGLNGSQAETIKNLDTFLMTINFEDDSILAGVKNVWHRIVFDKGEMYITCGVAIDVISPRDRLKLSGIIEKIRNRR